MKRWLKAVLAIASSFSLLGSAESIAPPPSGPKQIGSAYYAQFGGGSIVFHGSQSGYETLDGYIHPGNPFATAFVEALTAADRKLSDFANLLTARTKYESVGYQIVDTNLHLNEVDRPISVEGERRVAMVLITSDYSHLPGLPGAQFDAMRVASALSDTGFEVILALNGSMSSNQKMLEEFASLSETADVSLIYTTGHGTEFDGVVRLIGKDYDSLSGREGLEDTSIRLPDIASAGKSKSLNLIFYAGCRNNPFKF